MKVMVAVVDEDIASGHQGDCWNCPLALAVNRALKGTEYKVAVWDDSMVLIHLGDKPHITIKHTEFVAAFVNSYDHDGEVEPFTFELEFNEDPRSR